MYIGFNVNLSDPFVAYRTAGEQMFKEQELQLDKTLDRYVNPETGALVGKVIEEDWFPVGAYDIFISHSHNDGEQALALAAWLKEKFHLSVFMDSALWGSADTLLRKIDQQYSRLEESPLYDYYQRNFSTSHVHMLVAMALAKVIDNTECFMFLHTPNTLPPNEETVSRSPWLYVELVLSQLIKKRKPKRLASERDEFGMDAMLQQREQLEIEYDVHSPLNDLIVVCEENLSRWEQSYEKKSPYHALDYLYGQFK